MSYSAAIDTSAQHAAFAVCHNETSEILIEDHSAAIGRKSAGFLDVILSRLAEHGLELNEIKAWTVGMGPGSFTGIRLGASLALGMAAGSDARVRGIASSLIMARSAIAGLPDYSGLLHVLHDGRREEAIVSSYKAADGNVTSAENARVLNLKQLDELEGRFIILGTDRCLPDLPSTLSSRLVILPHVDPLEFLNDPDWPEDTVASLEPVYVRPAVFVPPRSYTAHPAVTKAL